MSDAKIKIVSNPYLKTLEFFYWDNEWLKLDKHVAPNSKLLSQDFSNSFFPFKAKEIIDKLYSEYRGAENLISIIFEGSDDEFRELSAVCRSEEYIDCIQLEQGTKQLSNARDILPEIVRLFKSIRPIIDKSVMEKEKIKRELEKFYDVSSDLIPLCILGNYSAGKSTFINALIGYELLPNGDMPVTAKVFQIKRSKQQDRACICFTYNNQSIMLSFNKEGIIDRLNLPQNELCDMIFKTLEGVNGMIPQMNASLQVLNSFKRKKDSPSMSDLIEVEVPFCQDDPWALSHEFIIFDTPGSNSASNEDHIRVLRNAMEGLSNGLPIYIAEYSSLDSTDNAKLYDEIKQIEAMDERFAMIVVNKADIAELPKGCFTQDEIERIMDMAVPHHLYAQGIYFVSSVLGLGSKTDGEFTSDNYAEKYEDQERKYSNPENRFYKTLYRYNILPSQISERTNQESLKCSNLVFANSGLFCIEQEIVLFAERYSAYNKCQQSEVLLRRIIDITSDEIMSKKDDCQKHKEALEETLEKDKAKLLSDLDACGVNIYEDSVIYYSSEVVRNTQAEDWFISFDNLNKKEGELLEAYKEAQGYSEDTEEARTARKAISKNLGKRIESVFSSPSLEAIGDVFEGLADDIVDAEEKEGMVRRTQREAEIEASEYLLEGVKQEFDRRINEISLVIDWESRAFLEKQSVQGRETIYKLATNSSVLSDEKRREIAEIIIKYPALALQANVDEIFDKSKFNSLRLFNVLFYQGTRLNLDKISHTFNDEIEHLFDEIRSEIHRSHMYGYKQWLNELLGKIKNNITEYNPVLSRHISFINDDERKILELSNSLDTLQHASEYVSTMISWRE